MSARSARVTAVGFAVGLSLATPALAAADTGDTAPSPSTQPAKQTSHADTARSARNPLSRAPRSASRQAPPRAGAALQSRIVRAAPTALAVAPTPTPTANITAQAAVTGLLAPVQSFFDGIALLVRRTLFNQAPTVAPIQTTGQLVGPITGSIGAVDPEGDLLTYAVTEIPKYGSVVIGTDGHYVYTPGPAFTGLDSFNVAVTDNGFHINLLDPSRPASTEAFLQVAQNATLPTLTFNFVYGSGSQYWSDEARQALQDSAVLLAGYFVVTSPTTLVYNVTGEGSSASGTLASAGSDLTNGGAGFFKTVAQMKIQTGVDANGAAADGQIAWNFANPWAFGTPASNAQYDFTSTAMHELLHTLGFVSNTTAPGTNTARTWTTFDRYLVTSAGTAVISDTYQWRSAYDANLTGGAGGLYFGGPNAVAAYGGPVPLFTPDQWEYGSSMSHLDDNTFTGADEQLMNAAVGTGPGIRVLSPVELGILKDLGYAVDDPAPLSALVLIGFGFLRRRGQRPVS